MDIDTRSDIYALGVLLYELLTGRTPFDANELLRAGLDEMRRTIRDKQPPRPSNRISTLQGEDLTTTAKQRGTDPPKLIHLVRGDLDWIVMKALEKDRARRYESANGLAADIKRHLTNEPIVARPPSATYRFQKMVRRNKLAFAAASAVAAALIIGLGVSTWEFINEKAARQRAVAAELEQARLRQQAETEAAKATAVSDFLQEMLRSANPDDSKGSDYTVRQLLDNFSAGLGKQLAGQPEVEATVRATIGNAYCKLGVTDKAEPQLERALALRGRIYGEQSEEVAQSLVDLAFNLFEQFEQKRLPEAEVDVRRALDIYRKHGTDPQPVIHALWLLHLTLRSLGPQKEAETAAAEALGLARNSPQRDFPEIANIMHSMADAKDDQEEYAEAENLALQAVEMHRRFQGPEHPETAWSLLALGRALAGQHKLAEAERAFREALSIFRRYYSFQYNAVQSAVGRLRVVLEARGDPAAVEALYREVLAGQRAALGNDSPAVADTLTSLADYLLSQGQQAEAKKRYNEVETLYQEILVAQRSASGADSPTVASTLFDLANFLKSQNRPQEAAQKYRESLDILLKPDWEEHLLKLPWVVVPALLEVGNKQQATNICRAMLNSTSTNAVWFNAASWYLATTENPSNRDPALAVELATRAVKINPQGDWNTVGVAYYRAGDFKQAITFLEKRVQQLSGGGGSTDFFFQAMAEHQVGHADAARRYYAKAIQWMSENDPRNAELLRFRAEAERLLGSEIKAGAENQFPAPPSAK